MPAKQDRLALSVLALCLVMFAAGAITAWVMIANPAPALVLIVALPAGIAFQAALRPVIRGVRRARLPIGIDAIRDSITWLRANVSFVSRGLREEYEATCRQLEAAIED